jgi:NADPH:quinone reductase-like Zn-dependent oxidoreductase/ubiquinone/menaquinone biosynthesis C-methylase UbiE
MLTDQSAAAYAASMLTEEDAWKIAYFRGTCSGSLPTKHPELVGTMMAVALSESAAQGYTSRATSGKVVVACINSPLSVTLSGDEVAINEVEEFLKADEVWCRKLKVRTAYHSHHMKAIAEDYLHSIGDIKPLDSQSSITMFSSVTGNKIAAAQLGPSYWVENMLSPVRFSNAVAALLAPTDAKSRRQKLPNVQSLIEIGPHGVLKGPLNQTITACPEGYDKTVVYMSVLHRGHDAFRTAIETAGKLWGQGHDLNMRHVNTTTDTLKSHKVLTDLPPYPWNHKRSHWHEARQTAFRRLQPGPRTDLLGFACDGFHPLVPDPRWTNFIKPTAMPWVLDHVISGMTVLPGAAMLCMAIEACQQILDPSKTVEGFEFRDINFTRALSFQTPDQQVETAMQFRPHTLGTKASTFVWHKFTLTSIALDNVSTAHCNGLVRIKYVEKTSEIENGIEAAIERKKYKDGYEAAYLKSAKEVNVPAMYNDVINQGMQFGPLFRLLSDMRGGVDVGCASITIPDTASVMPKNYEYPLLIHPTVLDAVFGVLFSRAALSDTSTGTLSVISSIGSLYVDASIPNEPGTILRAYQTSTKAGWRDVVGDIVVSDAEFAKPWVVVKSVVSTGLATEGAEKETADASMLCTRLEWKQDVSSLSSGAEDALKVNNARHEVDLRKNADILEQSALIYMQRAIDALDADVAPNPSPLRSTEWAREILTALPCLTLSKELENVVLAASAESSSVGKVLQTIGSKLAGVISGTIDARELLIEEGLGDIGVFTDKVLGMELINAMMTTWFDMAGNKNPDLQVLEIGNGSVSTAVSILTALSGKNRAGPRYGQYTFTESDASRIDHIKALLKMFPNVDVQTLDIEQDLAKQNFKVEKYDVILINDMLRTVSSIDLALKNAKKLLNPGGKLVIGALSKLTCRTALILGLTEGWWTASANEIPQSHYLEEAEWAKHLSSNGLSPNIYIKDSAIEAVQQMSLIVSTLPKDSVKQSLEVVILEPLEASSSTVVLASNIQQYLIARDLIVTKATLGTIPEPANKIFISLLELDTALLDAVSENAYEQVKSLTTKSSGVLWITRGDLKNGLSLPSQSAAVGLFRTLRSEVPHLQLFNLDLSLSLDLTSERATGLIVSLFNTSFSEEEDVVIDHEFAEANGSLFIPRLVQDEAMNVSLTEKDEGPQPEMKPLFQPGRPLKMELGEAGLLDTFRFVDRPEYKLPLPADRVDIEIVATGLNFVDVMTALGYIPSTKLGAEFAGRVTAIGNLVPEGMFHIGQMVVGSTEECFATNTRVHWKTVVPVPDGMSPEAAATCVIAYTTAYFALFDNGRLKKGDTILIHSAAGGLGQAAVQLAQYAGAIVYATVGSMHKKELLMEKYCIPENHIFNSRDTTFAKGLMRETKGRGVDVILNSTFGEMLRESWNCLADFGIFVEVGKRDILSNNSLEMLPFIRGCTFSAFNLAQYTEDAEPHRLDACFEVVKKVFKLLGEGHVKPPDPLHVISITEAEKAFRALQSGRFAGKIVLMMKHDDIVPVMPEKQLPPELDSNATYLLAGGLGGIGKSLTELMVTLGAKNFAFVSRSGDDKEESKAFLAKLREDGVQAKAYACDITDREALENTLQQCTTEMPRIKGFVHCAMLLKVWIFAFIRVE